jgi:tetratricopeptide (TPR) repeat protein
MLSIFLTGLLSSVAVVVLISFFDFKGEQPDEVPPASVQDHQDADHSQLREQFIKQLQTYEHEIEPEISAANLKAWNLEKDMALGSRTQEAIAAFGSGNYLQAVDGLTKLEALAKQLIAERDAIFSSEISIALRALNEDDYTTGKLHVTRALLVKPDDQEAGEIAQRLEQIPGLLAVMKRADVARIENNLHKEYEALVEAVEIASHREALKQRRDALAERIKEDQFSTLISRGLSSVERQDISAARQHYKKARALFPDGSELRVLNESIIKVSVALDLKQSLAQADQAIKQDRWIKAQTIYAEALKRHPEERGIRDGLQLSSQMVSLQQAISDYISRPERLASRNIFASAENTVVKADVFARNSKSLAAGSARLKALLASMSVKIPVLVMSDNKTYIVVRGVGKVGVTAGREIELKPGAYTFEGSRKGYRSKLVQIRLPVGEKSFQVEVICDERI